MTLPSPTPSQRLQASTLDQLARHIRRPDYDRRLLKAGIVHLGIGAFMRAHLAPVTEAAIHASQDMRWGIVGVSLRQPDTRNALLPQDGLYTLAIRDMDANGNPREQLHILGCVMDILVATEHPEMVVRQIAAPDTRIVSLTITEKGYCHHPTDGTLQFDHPDIVHDLHHPDCPRTAVGFIVYGLQQRYAAGIGPLTLMSLDNLPSNGQLLQKLILSFAEQIDPSLARWICTTCTFPCSMVDRIVPRTTPADQRSISAALGLTDAWPVLGEPFLEWVIEDAFAAGRPHWNLGHARFVEDAGPWETLKLRMVNGAHSCIAYLGAIAGWQTVDVAMRQPALQSFLDGLMRTEIEPTLPALPGLAIADYRSSLLGRFANPALAHRTQQIAMDGSQKIPQRWLGTLADQLSANRSIRHLAICLAAWLRYLEAVDESGQAYDIHDPLAPALQRHLCLTTQHAVNDVQCLSECMRLAQSLCNFAPVFACIGPTVNPDLITEIASQLYLLKTEGVLHTLLVSNQADRNYTAATVSTG